MENKNKCVRVGISTVVRSFLAILVCAALPAPGEVVPSGAIWVIPSQEHPGPIAENLDVYGTITLNEGGEVTGTVQAWGGSVVNVNPGALVGQKVNAYADSEVNVCGGTMNWGLWAYPDASVTVYGSDFSLTNPINAAFDDPDAPKWVTVDPSVGGSGTLGWQYEAETFSLYFISSVDIALASAGVTVEIDIKPGSYPNTINLGSNGVVPVAILSTETLDATTLNPDNVFLAGSGVAVRGKGNNTLAHEEDVNSDGLLDLVVKVETENLDPGTFQDGYAVLKVHETPDQNSDVLYEGTDEITIVPPE